MCSHYQLEGQYYKVKFIFDDLFQPSLVVVCGADDLFQSYHDFFSNYRWWLFHVHFMFHSSLTNWRDKAIKLHLFLDDIFQPSPMLFDISIADNLFQSIPLESSPVQRLLTAIENVLPKVLMRHEYHYIVMNIIILGVRISEDLDIRGSDKRGCCTRIIYIT